MSFSPEEQQIIDWSRKNGKSVQEMKDAIFRYRSTGSPADPNKQVQEPSVAQDVAVGAAKGAGDTLKFMGGIAAKAAAQVTGANLIPGVNDAVDSGVQKLQDTVGLSDKNLAATNDAQRIGKGIEFGIEALSPFVLGRFAGMASKASQVAPKAAEEGAGLISQGVNKAKEFVANPKLALAKQNVEPQLQSSAERLFLSGTKRMDDPIATYEKYLDQSKKSIADAKVDPAAAVVGENIGDVFKEVVAKRRQVGKTMGEELKLVGGTKTDILPVIDKYVSSLADEGLQYDRVSKSIKALNNQTKMTTEDISILNEYARQLQRLGSKPTISELDAFMSRVSSQLDIYKSSKNITGTTNAERIVKGSLRELRDQFSPEKTGNKALEGYSAARKQYADLSSFIEEGAGFLGKMTQSGDFAKDASLAKSAVQSMLNNGKKDWLIKLEELTGYPAIDDTVLALQAMKDAGDFRAMSLLEELSKISGTGAVPTSATGVVQKAIDYAVSKVGRAVAGTPEEQTRAFLKALKESPKKADGNAVFGGIAGMKPDENGNVTVDPFNAAIGLTAGGFLSKLPKALEPVTLAKKLTAGQYKALKEYTLSRTSKLSQIPFKIFEKLDDALSAHKVNTTKMNLQELDDYTTSLVNAYEESI